ncbi:O-antigen ligase family protein [Paenibacillus psychroresistens]|nr:O-antigen ligase family protein [Paenibacillus psychroresistens]
MKAAAQEKSLKSPLIEGQFLKEKESLVFWASIIFIILFLFTAPFSYKTGPGLFNGYTETYEGRIYGAIIWSSIFLLVLSVSLWNKWRLRNWRDVLSVAVWTIPLFYLLSLIPAASQQLASNMVLISSLYAIFFLFGSYLTQGKLGSTIIQLAIVLAGYYIVLYGYMNMFGNAFYYNAVMFDQGLRITSIFQYANAYAAFLLAIFFASLYLVVSSRKWYWVMAHSMMLVPIMSSFWLTQSRGAYVLLPVIFVLILPFVSFLRQLQMSLYLIISIILGVSLTGKLIDIATPINTSNAQLYETGHATNKYSVFSHTSWPGWSRLVLVSCIMAVIASLIHYYVIPFILRKLNNRRAHKNLTVLFPVGLVVLGVISVILIVSDTGVTKLLPESLRVRVETINFQQHSVLERGTFYKDALKVVEHYPFGSGGGGWATLYEKYQNNPYTSRQAHNFPLQYLVEVGIIGFIALVGFLGFLYFLYFRQYFNKGSDDTDPRLVFYIVSLSIMVHSLLDFDISYVYLACIVFLCFGGMVASIPFRDIQWRRTGLIKPMRWIYPGVVTLIGVFILIIASMALSADRAYKKANFAITQNKPYEEITAALDSALAKKPNHPDFLNLKTNLMLQGYDQTKDESFYDQAVKFNQDLRRKEPFNRQGLDFEYQLYELKQQTAKMHDVLLLATQHFPWDTQIIGPTPEKSRESFYERLLSFDLKYGDQALKDNDIALKDKYFTEAKQIYALVQEKTKHLLTLPKGQGQGSDFKVTETMQAAMDQINAYDKNE